MKLFLLLCYIFASCTLAYAESDNKKIVKNGLDVLPLKTSQVIPFSEELFGRRVYFPQTTKCLQNRVHGKANGSFLIFCNTEIICIANKKNGLFDGELSIYPDGIFSVRATVKESVLNGWCRMAFSHSNTHSIPNCHLSAIMTRKKFLFRKRTGLILAIPILL